MKKLLLLIIAATCLLSTKAQWQTGGPAEQNIGSLAVSSAGILAGNENGGIYLSTNNGGSWSPLDSAYMANIYVLSVAVSGSTIFAGTNDGLYVSTNNGVTFAPADTGLAGGSRVQAIAVSGGNIFAGTAVNGIFLSTDNGSHWAEMNTGLTDTDIDAIVVSGSNIFTATYGGGVFLSSNNGGNWAAVNTDLTDLDVLSLAINGNFIYAGTETGSIFLSSNNGASWTSVFSIEAEIEALAISGNDIYAGTYGGGVFLSIDTGGAWNASNTGLTYMDIYALTISDTTLFAGTFEGGVWQQPIAEQTIVCDTPITPVPFFSPSNFYCTGDTDWFTVTARGTLICSSIPALEIYQQNDTNYFFILDSPGNYTLTVKDSTCAASAPFSTMFDVYASPNPPIVTLVGNDTLTTDTAFGYEWLLDGSAISGANNQTYIADSNGNYQVSIINEAGCMAISAVYNLTTLGIADVNSANSIRLYPNPTSGEIYFTGIKPGNTLEIYDVLGEMVYSSVVNTNDFHISLAGNAKGIYFYRVADNSSLLQQGKLVVE